MEFTVKVENRLTLYLANTKPSVDRKRSPHSLAYCPRRTLQTNGSTCTTNTVSFGPLDTL